MQLEGQPSFPDVETEAQPSGKEIPAPGGYNSKCQGQGGWQVFLIASLAQHSCLDPSSPGRADGGIPTAARNVPSTARSPGTLAWGERRLQLGCDRGIQGRAVTSRGRVSLNKCW